MRLKTFCIFCLIASNVFLFSCAIQPRTIKTNDKNIDEMEFAKLVAVRRSSSKIDDRMQISPYEFTVPVDCKFGFDAGVGIGYTDMRPENRIIGDFEEFCVSNKGGNHKFIGDKYVCMNDDQVPIFTWKYSKKVRKSVRIKPLNNSLHVFGTVYIHILKQTAIEDENASSLKFVNTRETSSGELARIHIEISKEISDLDDVIFFNNGSEIYAEELGTYTDQSNFAVRKSYNIKVQRGLNVVKAVAYGTNKSVKIGEAYLKIVGDYELDTKPSLYAIVIGIDNYNDKKMNLNFAEADASLFGTTLYKLTKDIYKSVNIHYLRKEHETTKKAILNALTRFQNISPNDYFIFFSSAHGVIVDDIFYLINSDTQTTSLNSLKLTAINHFELLQLFKRIPTANKLLLFDTCHSGLINTKVSKELFEHSQKKINITSISASQAHQFALEGYADGHGVFTYVISDALEGLADLNGDGIISSMELVLYANEHVPKAAKKLNHVQIPAFFQAGQVFPITKHRLNQKDFPSAPLYFSENEIEMMVAFLQSGNLNSFNQMLTDKKNDTDLSITRIKQEAEKNEASIVENEFKLAQQSFSIDRIKFIFHDDSVFLGVTDQIKDHFTFVDDNGHKLLVLDFYSNKFTKHSVNRIDTTKISKIDIGWHNTFYRVTLHLEKLSFYDLKITDSGVYIKIRDR
jgi:hypothetical protein